MAGTVGNIKVEPMQVIWDGVDLGFTEGDIEMSQEEQATDITAHQEGTTVLDAIRTGRNVTITTVLKETSVAQINKMLQAGESTATAAAEVTSVTAVADVSSSLDGTYFTINSALDATGYYVWINVAAGGNDPAPSGLTGIAVAISANDDADTVAAAIQTAVDAEGDFGASVSGSVVTITNAATGGTTDAADVDSGFTIAVTTQGISAVDGFGKGKRFTGQIADAKKLRLHPTALASTDLSRDWNFWKAYPMFDSMTFSGENPQTMSITWKAFPDSSRADTSYIGVYGEGR